MGYICYIISKLSVCIYGIYVPYLHDNSPEAPLQSQRGQSSVIYKMSKTYPFGESARQGKAIPSRRTNNPHIREIHILSGGIASVRNDKVASEDREERFVFL